MNLPINQVLLGDAIEVLKSLPDNSVDALISDPPAGISFMSRDFDRDRGGMIPWVNWLSEIMSESLRVMKPGAIGLIWSIPRTCGWTQLALELAGFRVIDSIAIMNGQSMPKGADISKHIDKLYGLEREIIGDNPNPGQFHCNNKVNDDGWKGSPQYITAPNHPDAVKWDGWKSAQLKPSHEDWFIVQKKVEGTIARNVVKWGVGGVNIEACRIESDWSSDQNYRENGRTNIPDSNVYGDYSKTRTFQTTGRYPANTILVCSPECDRETHAQSCPVSILGEQSGISKANGRPNSKGKKYSSPLKNTPNAPTSTTFSGGYLDTGTAARYFKQLPHDPETFETFKYQTKASQRDRSCDGAVENIHPTVKNRSLMRYFCKLITPPNGIVLDPFGGSGSTAIGAIEEGFNYLLIEKEEEYHAIALARIAATLKALNVEQLVLEVFQ